LPELHLEYPDVTQHIFGSTDSLIQGYLRDGVDGWRLDVATELGFELLKRITEAVHVTKSDAITICEIWNYPEQWSLVLDGIMNFHARRLIYALVQGSASAAHVGHLLAQMIEDVGVLC